VDSTNSAASASRHIRRPHQYYTRAPTICVAWPLPPD